MEMLSEHTLRRLARGLPADRPPRLLPHLRGVRPRHRLDVQPARQVARHQQEPRASGAPRSRRRTSCCRRRSGARTTTGSRTRIPGSSISSRTRARRRARVSICRPTPTRLLAVADHCLRSTDYINVIVADKQKHLQFTTIDEAIIHCTKGIGIWARASTDAGEEPDVVLASLRRRRDAGGAGRGVDPARALAGPEAALRQRRRSVQAAARIGAPARIDGARSSTACSPTDKPIIFNFHGYPWLIHRLSYRFTQSRQPARPRLQGEGQHQHAARAGDTRTRRSASTS